MPDIDVRLVDVTKAFGPEAIAVDHISLDVHDGEFFSLLGPSGCGKTTTLRMIGGFEEPTSGLIELQGQDVTWLPPYKRNVNTVFQNYALFPHLTIYENVAFGLRRRKVSADEVKRRVPEMLELVELRGFDKRKPGQISGGQAQRVALARALINRPAVLLLDEPLGALDLKLRKQMQIELKRIQQDVGITFIYVTHDQEEAMTMSDRVAVMNRGRYEQLGAPQDLYERPTTRFVAGFLGASNLLRGRVEGVDGQRSMVRLDGSTVIRLPTSQVAGRTSVDVGVRPEKIRMMELDGRPGPGQQLAWWVASGAPCTPGSARSTRSIFTTAAVSWSTSRTWNEPAPARSGRWMRRHAWTGPLTTRSRSIRLRPQTPPMPRCWAWRHRPAPRPLEPIDIPQHDRSPYARRPTRQLSSQPARHPDQSAPRASDRRGRGRCRVPWWHLRVPGHGPGAGRSRREPAHGDVAGLHGLGRQPVLGGAGQVPAGDGRHHRLFGIGRRQRGVLCPRPAGPAVERAEHGLGPDGAHRRHDPEAADLPVAGTRPQRETRQPPRARWKPGARREPRTGRSRDPQLPRQPPPRLQEPRLGPRQRPCRAVCVRHDRIGVRPERDRSSCEPARSCSHRITRGASPT